MADPLQSLLTWSIENTDTSARSTAPRAALHPCDNEPNDAQEAQLAPSSAGPEPTPSNKQSMNSDIIDTILGKGDAVNMREKLDIAMNEEEDVNERVLALDEFEMMIEHIDNANDIENMKMWPRILSLLDSPQDPVIYHAAWICGTAIQNNMKAQQAFFAQDPLPKIFSLISAIHPTDSSVKISAQTRAKSVYCLSAALKHWPEALQVLSKDSNRGWDVLKRGLRDPDATTRRKIAFLLETLIMQAGSNMEQDQEASAAQVRDTITAMQDNGIVDALVLALTEPTPVGENGTEEPDWDFKEKALKALWVLLQKDGVTTEQKRAVAKVLEDWGKLDGQWEDIGLDGDEVKKYIELCRR